MLGRVHDHRPAVAVGEALALMRAGLRDLTACEFVVGVDPIFAGVHREIDAHFPYADTAHVIYDHHQLHRPLADRSPKVILPTNPDYRWDTWYGVQVVVHELGHVLHQRVGWGYVAEPVTEYAETNHYEAFAEAFATWIWGGQIDAPTTALFDRLAY